MFRWLKDRKKSRKPSTGSSESVRSKEDDYGFKQKHPEWKRDLPPTPLDSASSLVTFPDDDNKSFHIYEEIPDLPFRCTPEGELRITLARETNVSLARGMQSSSRTDFGQSDESRRDLDQSRTESDSSAKRTISPYMVVPLERVSGTPLDFQRQQQQDGNSFACALVGRRRSPLGVGCDGAAEDASQGTSTPSCDDSSVFGTPLGLEGRCAGLGGGDISDRLLNAINLTRLLAAVRLSSSSAETCTTSPICIGVDRDGRSISVSLSVTPTTTLSANHEEDVNNDVTDDVADHVTGSGASEDVQRQEGADSGNTQAEASNETHSGAVSRKPQAETGTRKQHAHQHTTGLRFLPSPSEQNALSEILHLQPGESTELDPATIDAIILRLCSESLSQDDMRRGKMRRDQTVREKTGSHRDNQDSAALSAAEFWLSRCEQLLSNSAHHAQSDSAQGSSSGEQSSTQSKDGQQQSPKSHRTENSDTCYEYDISTSSESDQTNYDYFLSKVARTRHLECEVKKIIQETESLHGSQDSDCEEERGIYGDRASGGSFTSVSSVSQSYSSRHFTQRKVSPELANSADSDDGTMADLSESENSSGYYESTPMQGLSRVPDAHKDNDKAVRFSTGASAAARSGSVFSERNSLDARRFSCEADISGGSRSGLGLSDPETHTASAPSFPHSRKGSAPAVGLGLSSLRAASQDVQPRSQHARTCKGKCLASKKHGHRHHRHNGHKCGGKGKAGKESMKTSSSVENVYLKSLENMESDDHGAKDSNDKMECKDDFYIECKDDFDIECTEILPGTDSSCYSTRQCCFSNTDALNSNNCSRNNDDSANKACFEDHSSDSKNPAQDCNSDSKTCSDNCEGEKDDSAQYSDASKKDSTKSRQEKVDKSSRKHFKDRPHIKTTTKVSKETSRSSLYTANSSAAVGNGTTDLSRGHKTSRSLKARGTKDRSSALDSERAPSESAYEERRHAGEVYSIPAALTRDPASSSSSVRGLKGSTSVPSKLSVARQVPESSEVYGTRAGLSRCNNRLLSDLIMLNYNRQVFNHV